MSHQLSMKAQSAARRKIYFEFTEEYRELLAYAKSRADIAHPYSWARTRLVRRHAARYSALYAEYKAALVAEQKEAERGTH